MRIFFQKEGILMQWDKVKSILLVILLVVDSFLAWNLSQSFLSRARRERETFSNVRTLAAQKGVQLAPGFSIPSGGSLPALEAERSIRAEDKTAASLLGENPQREDSEDGSARYQNEFGESIRFSRDGSVDIRLRVETMPQSRSEFVRFAELRLAGFPSHGGQFHSPDENGTVRLTADVAGVPLFDRVLEIRFDNDWLLASGRWTLELPYTTTGSGSYCDGADALLTYACLAEEDTTIYKMTLGYRFGEENAGRIPLVVCWRMETDKGMEFLDTSKMTILPGENS